MKKWWNEHWYAALVILIVGGILLYCWGLVNFRTIEGVLIKTESDHLYLLRTDTAYDKFGSIVLTPAAKKTVDRAKYNTGDRVRLRGKISIAELWPAQYHGVRRIIVDQRYDEESLQIVKDKVQNWQGEFFHIDAVYPE